MPIHRLPLTPRRTRVALCALLLAGGSACYSPAEQLANADRDTYAVLEKRRAELGAEGGFSIEPPVDSLRQRMLDGATPGPLGLIETLNVAAENSRDFQRRKEDLYLSALDLTLERFAFQAQRSGQIAAVLDGSGAEAQNVSFGAGAAVRRLLGAGAQIIGDVGLSLARNISTGDGWGLTSDLGLSVTQPLLRGFGKRIVMEPLTQAERNVVYQARSFERFRRTFAVDVTSRYLRILQQMSQLENERANFDNLQQVRERNEALSLAGRLSEVQVAQAQQNELSSKVRLIEQEQRLQTALDNFKLFLGLPIHTPLALEPGEVEQLDAGGGLDVPEELAIDFALAQRLDHLTVLDQVADAERKVPIAANRLLAGIDVTTSVEARSEVNRPLEYDKDNVNWLLGLDVTLPIDLIGERNAYRESLVTLERAKRAQVESADSIRVALRDELRQARTQLETLRIQENAVELAERRIESTQLNQQAGRAETRDILEAQEALRQARNALIAARVDFHLARLSLWRDMELLRVDEAGVGADFELLEGEPWSNLRAPDPDPAPAPTDPADTDPNPSEPSPAELPR
jgi:outer membrane protein TolC